MKTMNITVREGEWVGPIDWNYDFYQHRVNKHFIDQGIDALKRFELDAATTWYFRPSRMTSYEVVEVGMYDGWPFWRPTPAIGYRGPLGAVEVAFFYSLSRDKLYADKR